ncbi:MAG TPA: SPFH domain-containing protein [Chitinophagales bacterium]|nr:SPFH domain-containing protein [Chitinophagales bacterium]
MGLFDAIKHQLIDIIEWTDNTSDTLVWKFPRFQNEIKMGAKLIVRESQQAVFMNEGKIADVFQPGTYTLETQNMPVLTTLMGWKYGFNSPFKVDVFFVSTRQFIDQKWGTKNPITLNDDRFGLIELRAFGSFAYRVTDGGKFIKEVAGTEGEYTTDEVNGQLKSLIVTKFTNAAGTGNLPIEKFAANLEELSSIGQEKLNADFDEYGLKITKFLVENVSMPDDLKKEIFEYSRLNKIDMQKFAQFKTAQSIETAAENQGFPGMGVGFGVGMGMGNMVTNAFGNQMNQQNTNVPPPPPPVTQFFIAVNGQQTGPFSYEQMQQMAQSGQLRRDSLIWKAGMASWAQASTVTELNNAFNNVPPPPPPAS